MRLQLGILAAGVMALALPARADVIVLRNGERLEGLIVNVDDTTVSLRWGVGNATATRRIPRRDIAEIRLSPPDVRALRDQARRADSAGRTDEAVAAWQAVCALQPDAVGDQLGRIQALRRAGKLAEARAAAEAIGRENPDELKIALEHAEICFALGDAGQAIDSAKKHLERSGDRSVPGYWILGRALEASGRHAEAIDAYRGLLGVDPLHAGALDRLVAACLALRDPRGAEDAARAYIRWSPRSRAGYVALGRVFYREGRHPEAVETFRAATALGGDGYDRARVFLHCARARVAGTDPLKDLLSRDREFAADLDPDLGRDKP